MAPRLAPYRQSLAGVLLAAREAVMTPLRPVLRDANVTEQQWRVLRVLADEGQLEASRLADSAMLQTPSVSRILRELEMRALIVRSSDAKDRRKALIALSPEGRALLEKTAQLTLVVLEAHYRKFGRARLDGLITELRAMTAMISAPDPAGGKQSLD